MEKKKKHSENLPGIRRKIIFSLEYPKPPLLPPSTLRVHRQEGDSYLQAGLRNLDFHSIGTPLLLISPFYFELEHCKLNEWMAGCINISFKI